MTEHSFTALFHIPAADSPAANRFAETLESIFTQTLFPDQLLGLSHKNSVEIPEQFRSQITVIQPEVTFASQLLTAFHSVTSTAVVYIHNQTHPVLLKTSALDILRLTLIRHPDTAFIYSDYERLSGNNREEIHLLDPHEGRVRDNQDLGYVYALDAAKLHLAGYNDATLIYNPLYDLRLRMMEMGDVIHLSNKIRGSLYQVEVSAKGANVFDYLLASKESQQEAEDILSAHLRRIRAYLEPGKYYRERPNPETPAVLKASVIIPVYNRPEFIDVALESILAQTISEIEAIVVVNGGQDDPTIPVVKEFMPGGSRYRDSGPDVQLIVTDINNIGFCLNLGVRSARGEYYVQLDSDDRLKPNAVEKIIATYEEDQAIGMVIGSYEVWEKLESGEIIRVDEIPVVTHDEWTEDNGRNNLLRINGAGAPRSLPIQLIKEIGYFGMNDDPFARNYGEDYEMVLRVSEHYRIGRIYDPIYEVIRHAGGTDHSIDQATVDLNDEAKDRMRREAILRRQRMNRRYL
ncbi:MAG: glycosyltransferase family 2 protein [FCB group bacterium]|nr:glycosyltransferase family 2 protein [FCB group bacterium]